jgi:hypothetical protein
VVEGGRVHAGVLVAMAPMVTTQPRWGETRDGAKVWHHHHIKTVSHISLMTSSWRPATLEELQNIVRDVILPELVQLRQEVYHLRKHTWPHVQASKENGAQLGDMEAKREFFSNLCDEDVKELLALKAKSAKTMGLSALEYDRIKKNHRSDTS